MKDEGPKLDQTELDHMDNSPLPNGGIYTGQAKRVNQDGQDIMI